MSSDLPVFRRVKRSYAASIANSVLSSPRGAALLRLIEYEDHHFRAIFDQSYFQLQAGKSAPSKSQWSTLKKKFKRRNRSIFVFRAHGELPRQQVPHAHRGRTCLFVDFGFMLD
ncbi:MAG: hypothetical protein OXG92_07165 [Chloroflexi bacterium]|nr:hypothetical protein [Chloroflexota bacterium]MCY3583839.1 hypothetical protein [Chloroflexota bacterium]MCY3716229.1 hypothetical protein [Chloroflexota bacterium]MDE2650442.1 hypothetical protein [Chloroflexota bacterium]MXV93199.1 hypothetical protein [Chloroflexota bacterium]